MVYVQPSVCGGVVDLIPFEIPTPFPFVLYMVRYPFFSLLANISLNETCPRMMVNHATYRPLGAAFAILPVRNYSIPRHEYVIFVHIRYTSVFNEMAQYQVSGTCQ